jgi:hypothetical protein
MANMFEKAKATETVKPKAKGKTKFQADISDLNMYAAIQAAKKTLETMETSLKSTINDEALDLFVQRKTAESFNGVDGDTTASLQLRKRSGRSVLSEQEQIVLKGLGISTEKSGDTKFYIDSKYAEDGDLLEKVSTALDGIVPDDFFGHTGEKFVTTGDSIREAFEKCEGDELRDVLKIVGTQAARTKFGGSHDDMVEILDSILKG